MYQIKTTTPEDHLALLTFLYQAGYSYPSAQTIANYNSLYGAFAYPFILIYDNTDLGGNREYNSECGEELTYPQDITEIFNRILKIEKSEAIFIANVGDYDATVTKDGISIYGQTIPFDKFDEIAAAFAKLNP